MADLKWIDISQPLTNDMAYWPGDTPFSYELTFSKNETGSVNIGQITTSVHTGTHIDAPYHFDENGITVDQLDLNIYIGACRVLDVSHADQITVDVMQQFTWDSGIKRLLLKTSLPNNPKKFPTRMPQIDPGIAAFLQEKGVRLLGVDMPSVDATDSKELRAHHALNKHEIYILENIMLDHVSAGDYELIALPLAIHGSDGSPVRAVIRPL